MKESTFLDQFSSCYRWKTAPAKRRFRVGKRINKNMRETHRLALTLKGVIDRSLDDLDGLQSSDYSTYQIFESGDIVFKLIDLENIKTSRVGLVPRRGIMSPAYIRLIPSRSADSRYYRWLFFAAYVNNIFNGMGGGVRQNLTSIDLLEFPIPLPDISDQCAIADFLDRETNLIDQFIEKKQRLVELLEEKRDSLITGTVMGQIVDTHGNAKFTNYYFGKENEESNHIFLDQFSSFCNWKVTSAKRIFRSIKEINRKMQEKHRLALTMRGVIDRSLDDLDGLQSSDYSTYQVFERGDLVFKLIDLENIKTSRVGLVPKRGIMSPAYIRLVPNRNANSRYYYWLFFAAYINNIFNGMGGGVRQNLTPTDLLEFPVPLPDINAQKTIADFLEQEIFQFNQAIEKIRVSIDRLKEYRSALITHVVTGQIDVANWTRSDADNFQPNQIQPETKA